MHGAARRLILYAGILRHKHKQQSKEYNDSFERRGHSGNRAGYSVILLYPFFLQKNMGRTPQNSGVPDLKIVLKVLEVLRSRLRKLQSKMVAIQNCNQKWLQNGVAIKIGYKLCADIIEWLRIEVSL